MVITNEKKKNKVFEMIMTENLSQINVKTKIKEAWRTLSKTNAEKTTLSHIIFTLWKNQRETILDFVNYRSGVIMLYQPKFINCNCVPVFWGILIMRDSMLTREQEEFGKSLYLSLNISMNLKLL